MGTSLLSSLRRESVLGSHYFELCALVAARELDQQSYEISAVMGDYATAAIMLTTADQHLPADRKPLLPPR